MDYTEIKKRTFEFAETNNISVNSDLEKVNRLLHALLKKETKFGETYCPCFVISGNKEEDSAIICPCKRCLLDVEDRGTCHCQLFVKKEKR
jgi:ferredoxin-thioredoxin reductase catalytic subunit